MCSQSLVDASLGVWTIYSGITLAALAGESLNSWCVPVQTNASHICARLFPHRHLYCYESRHSNIPVYKFLTNPLIASKHKQGMCTQFSKQLQFTAAASADSRTSEMHHIYIS